MIADVGRGLHAAEILEITREFSAPPQEVFELWTRPELVTRWWGPKGRRLSFCEMDFRVGGKWRFCLRRVEDGPEHWVHGQYLRIEPPRRLEFSYVNAFDEHEMRVSIEFADVDGSTRMRFRQEPFLSAEQRDAHRFGWSSTFELLEEYLQSTRGT